jgi:hypothetical protein
MRLGDNKTRTSFDQKSQATLHEILPGSILSQNVVRKKMGGNNLGAGSASGDTEMIAGG